MVRGWLVLPAKFVAAALASSSASVADSSEEAAPYTDPALANAPAPWWYTDSAADADSKANTYAAADTDPYADATGHSNSDAATNSDPDAKADADPSSNPDSSSGQAYADAIAP